MDTFRHSYLAKENPSTVSLAVKTVGHQKCIANHSWGSGIRDHYLIHHIINGKGIYRTPYGEYNLNKGDTFLIYPFIEVSYIADENDPWEYYWVGFVGSDADIIIEQTDFTQSCPVISTDFGDKLQNSLSSIYSSIGQEKFSTVKMTGYLYITLSLLMENSEDNKSEANIYKGYIKSAKQYIRYYYSYPISVDEISEFVGISRSTLYRAFVKNLDIGPNEYLTNFRIKQATKLLEETDLSISLIAKSVGYEDSLYFSKVFKAKNSITPTQFREENKKPH